MQMITLTTTDGTTRTEQASTSEEADARATTLRASTSQDGATVEVMADNTVTDRWERIGGGERGEWIATHVRGVELAPMLRG